MKKPSIFEYTDFKQYLNDLMAYNKKTMNGFSVRGFSLKAFGHPSLLNDVLKSRRPLSQNNRFQLLSTLRLTKRQHDYLETLILYSQSKGKERAHYWTNLGKYKDTKARMIQENERKYYQKWYYQVLFNYFACQKSSPHPSVICRQIKPTLKIEEVREGISLLLKLNLIKKTANGYAVNEERVSTASMDRETALSLTSSTLNAAQERLRNVSPDKAVFGNIVLATNQKGFSQIREKLQQLGREIREIVENNSPEENVYSVSLQLYENTSF